MITHYIIMSSSYSKGKRIALSYVFYDSEYDKLNKILEDIIKECGKDVSISTHFVQTESESWKSVVEKDHFFKDVEIIKDEEDFIKLIKQDRALKGIDVAKYILSKVKCTHLKLEKLVYLCFAEYLCKYDKKLFNDQIFAYKYGPVVKSVYDKYRGGHSMEIEQDEKDIDAKYIYEMPSRSRIMFAEDGIGKIKVIDETIEKYGDLSANDLVKLTHKKNTPWDISGRGQILDKIIENDIIKRFHCNEVI